MPGKSSVQALVSLAIGLGIALILSELVVRVTGLASPLTYLPNPLYGWTHTPGDTYTREIEDRIVEVRINSRKTPSTCSYDTLLLRICDVFISNA